MRQQKRHPANNPAVKRRPLADEAPRSLQPPGWLLALLLVAGVFIACMPVWQAGFIWDDDDHLTQNPCIVGPLGFKAIWTTGAAVYYPLVLTTFWIQHALWGLNPLPYHLLNVAMHAACALLLWRVLQRLRVPGAWFGAALWALHPVQVESVAWITELKNTQSCFFYLLAILFFLKWRVAGVLPGGRSGEGNYALALLCAALAILSKTSTVILPVVLGLCWWWIEGRWRWRNGLRLAPFFLISGLASAWTIWEQKFHSGALGPEWAQTGAERLVIAGKVVWFYLGKLLWPHPLIFIYPRWAIAAAQPAAYLPVLAVVVTLLILWRYRNGRMRPLFFAFACFLVSLFPVLGFFNIYFFRYSFVGDHFQYLASLGPLVLVAAAVTSALSRLKGGQRFLQPVLCGTVLLGLGALTWQQTRLYRDNQTLFQATLDRNPNCWIAQNNLSLVLLAAGQAPEAKVRLEQALALKPDYAEAHNNLGAALDLLGQRSAAIDHYRRATQLKPDYTEAWINLAIDCFLTSRPQADALAVAQKALDLARSRGQKAFARRMEEWIMMAQPQTVSPPGQRLGPGQ
jgi:tetratricopeptide (TPR) repeat protein